MGCCQSRSHSPPPHGGGSIPQDSSRAHVRRRTSSRDGHEPVSSRRHAADPSHRPNQPIQKPKALETSPKSVSNRPPPWTRSHLEHQRRIFFETRVSGTPEVWNTLQVICEYLRHDDVAGAQVIFDAANLTCPHGKVARSRGRDRAREGVFDEHGTLYDIPYWVVTDPQDIVDDEGKDIDAEEDEEEEANDADLARRREKGKGRAESMGNELRVKVRLSDRASDMDVTIGSRQNVAVLKRAIREQVGGKDCRLVHLGSVLDDSKTLEAQRWKVGHVINAFITDPDECAVTDTRT